MPENPPQGPINKHLISFIETVLNNCRSELSAEIERQDPINPNPLGVDICSRLVKILSDIDRLKRGKTS